MSTNNLFPTSEITFAPSLLVPLFFELGVTLTNNDLRFLDNREIDLQERSKTINAREGIETKDLELLIS